QSALSAAVATVGGSGSLPVILRPDEVSEALKVGVNELLSLYGVPGRKPGFFCDKFLRECHTNDRLSDCH
ncbi:hypothetical protein ACUOIV_29035, partial [Escherichia coli]